MKALHDSKFFGWSVFDATRDLDFHSVLWVGPHGNVLIDPLPLSSHDEAHLMRLGGATVVIVTNSDHVRDARRIAALCSAKLLGPRAEERVFPIRCDGFIGEGDEPVPGLSVMELSGSKTPGELALVIQGTTLLTGDLVRGHRAGRLNLLPAAKLTDEAAARRSLKRLADLPAIEAVLVGDGWPVFRDGARALRELLSELETLSH